MKLLKNIVLSSIVGMMALSAGCGEHESVKAMNDFAEKTCKCEDMKCITDAGKEMVEIAAKYKDAKVSQGDADKIKAATEKATKCITDMPAKLNKK